MLLTFIFFLVVGFGNFDFWSFQTKQYFFAQGRGTGVALLSQGVQQFMESSVLDSSAEESETSCAKFTFDEGEIKIYRPTLFKEIRTYCGMSDRDYIKSISPEHLRCISSDSKSGQMFWLSDDAKLVLKTIKHYECCSLRRILTPYRSHVVSADRSSIAPVLGVIRVKKGWTKKYYLITRNVFPSASPSMNAENGNLRRYDLKGSTVGRIASALSSVKKDVDLMTSGSVLHLGDSKSELLKILARDTQFLKQYGFMDYSLLVAVENDATKNAHRFAMSDYVTSLISLAPEDKGKLVLLGSDDCAYHFGIIDFLQRFALQMYT